MGLDVFVLTAIGIASGMCLGTLVVYISFYAVADDLPTSDETGPTADGGM